jgi:small subunit ribosomal protein S2
MSAVSMKRLLEAGVHFGHQTRRWNPKMRDYIFAERNGIHIIDLGQTVTRLDAALEFVRDTVRHGDSILFVGTKKQAQESLRGEAERSGQHYVNSRWLGGMLTNFTTIKRRVQRLDALEARRDAGEFERLTKKEASKLTEEIAKLNNALGGIRRMRRLPGALFIVDPHRETIAVAEARRLEIPIVAITDTNCDPDLIDWVIPGNDDAIRSVKLICTLIADAVLEAQQERQARLDDEFEQAEALPPVDEAALGKEADYSAVLAAGEALVFEPEPEDDEEEERRARARRAIDVDEVDQAGEPIPAAEAEQATQAEPAMETVGAAAAQAEPAAETASEPARVDADAGEAAATPDEQQEAADAARS